MFLCVSPQGLEHKAFEEHHITYQIIDYSWMCRVLLTQVEYLINKVERCVDKLSIC